MILVYRVESDEDTKFSNVSTMLLKRQKNMSSKLGIQASRLPSSLKNNDDIMRDTMEHKSRKFN